jgi:hypothetical protein
MSEYTELGYLGDGVYLSHDGYQLWLAVNHHENKVVALEPSVSIALVHALLKYHFRSVIKDGVVVSLTEEVPE